jgi:hypothetical protein
MLNPNRSLENLVLFRSGLSEPGSAQLDLKPPRGCQMFGSKGDGVLTSKTRNKFSACGQHKAAV